MAESRCRRRVRKVIRWHVHSLYRCNGSVFRRCDTFLHLSHLRCQGRLIADCGRHSSQKCRHLGSCLSESENIIDKEQNILRTIRLSTISKGLCQSQPGQGHRRTCSRRFIHLPEYHSHLRLLKFIEVYLRKIPVSILHSLDEFIAISDDSRFDHFAQEVISFTCALSDPGKD